MVEARSKVTRRPRSRLERLLEPLGALYNAPTQPRVDVLTQLTIVYLMDAGADAKRALTALGALCDPTGAVDAQRLCRVGADAFAAFCAEDRLAELIDALHAAGKLASQLTHGLDARCREDLAEARAILRTLPRLAEPRVDLLLLYTRAHAIVAPTPFAMRAASRLGYPGATYAAIARALDLELSPGQVDIAWRAHHLLDQHGRTLCSREAPSCGRCPVRAGCSYEPGADPAARLPSWIPPKS